MKKTKKFVVVTTDKKGVFAGYIEDPDTKNTTVKLTEAQMCVYWDEATRGVVGLAANGPTKGCRITPPAPSMTLHGVTAVMESSAKSEEAWKSQPWN
jgi:hypothetical protein